MESCGHYCCTLEEEIKAGVYYAILRILLTIHFYVFISV